MDKISIKNLEVFAKHGVYTEEKALGQKFIISVVLYTDLSRAGKSDSLENSIDYGKICALIKSFVEKNIFNLIETVAENLAEKLLVENALLQKVHIEVKKPWAPVAMHLETISIEIERGRHKAYIALGSNMGDRRGYLNFAVEELSKARACRVVNGSQVIDTAPYGYTEQNNYLNACIELETFLSPHELLELLQDIEKRAGRERTVRWGPRTLDLDIIFYDDLLLSDDLLRIPHSDAHQRDFVLIPLNEIAPNYLHPIYKKTVAELLEELTRSSTATA